MLRLTRNAVLSTGYWFFPTIFSAKSNELSIMKEENFGPVVAVLEVSDFDQALAYANDSEYGRSAYVFSRDHRARHALC